MLSAKLTKIYTPTQGKAQKMDTTVEISEATWMLLCSQLVMDWHPLFHSHRSRHITIHAYRHMKKHPFIGSLSHIESQAKSCFFFFSLAFSFLLSWQIFYIASTLDPFSLHQSHYLFICRKSLLFVGLFIIYTFYVCIFAAQQCPFHSLLTHITTSIKSTVLPFQVFIFGPFLPALLCVQDSTLFQGKYLVLIKWLSYFYPSFQ